MTKKLLLLCLTALFSTAIWAYNFSATSDDGQLFYLNYVSQSAFTCEVTYESSQYKATDAYNVESIDVPATITDESGQEWTIVSIGDCAFYESPSLTSVTFPETLTSIGMLAFESVGITSITLPASLISFSGYGAFQGCTKLESVEFEEGIQLSEIPQQTFMGCSSLTYIEIPNSVTTIGNNAFQNCTSLTSISLPSGLTSIEKQLFYNCTALTTIEIPAGVTTIDTTAFEDCSSLATFTVAEGNTTFSASDDGVLFDINKTTLEVFPLGSSATSYEVPEGVTAIASYAFYDCVKVTEITFPESLTTIGSDAFYGCTGLTEIAFPEGLTTIDTSAFQNCTSLTEITFPKSLTTIGSSAFRDCTGLTCAIIIPDNVTSLGSRSFYDCTGITSLTLGENLTTIETYTFYNCRGLTELTIPDKVTSIGTYAFDSCTGLESLVLGASLSEIGNAAFRYGTSSHSDKLREIYSYNETAPTLGSSNNVFYYRDLSSTILYVPEGSTSSYESKWSVSNMGSYNNTDFASIVELGNVEVGTIFKYGNDDDGYLWYRTTSETTCEIILPQDGDTYRFNWDDDIYLTIPEYAEYAGEQFLVTRIDDYAFDANQMSGSTHLTDIQGPLTIPANIVSIGKSAFANNSDLASDITFADGEEDLVLENTDEDGVEGRIFHESDNGGTVYLGRNIVFSGDPKICSPFYDDASCTNITIGQYVTEIPDYMFCKDNGNVAIRTIDFSNATSLETIGAHSFAIQDAQTQSNGITELTLPASLKSIGDGAFYGTKSLSTVTLQSANVTVGGPSVFGDGSQKRANAVNLYVPEGSLSDYEASDWGSVYYVAWADEEEEVVTTLYPTATLTSSGGTTYYYSTYYNSQYQIKLDGNWFVNVVEDIEENGSINDGTVDNNDYLLAGNAVMVGCTASNYDAEKGIVLTGLRANATPFISGYDNILYGSDTETTTNVNGVTEGYYFYMLSYDKEGENLGFYWGAANGAPFQSAAHKAWLALDATFAAGLSQLSFKKDIDDTTGISSVETDVEGVNNGAIYTIQGVRVNDMTQPGIYIQNGKKVLVK